MTLRSRAHVSQRRDQVQWEKAKGLFDDSEGARFARQAPPLCRAPALSKVSSRLTPSD